MGGANTLPQGWSALPKGWSKKPATTDLRGKVDTTPADQPGVASRAGTMAEDVGKGLLKGVGSTANSIGKLILPDRLLSHFGMHVPTETEQQSYFEPKNTAQRVGKFVEQSGEFLVPGLGEDAAMEHIPQLANRLKQVREAAPVTSKVGRLLLSGAESGAVNKHQGGNFGTGAEMGAAGEGIGMLLKKAAPALAETAMGTRAPDRLPSNLNLNDMPGKRSPGEAILAETKGRNLGDAAKQAYQKVGDLSRDQEDAARNIIAPARLLPARQAAESWNKSALSRNEPSAILRTGQILDQVSQGPASGDTISPIGLLHLRRGMGDVPASWNPATTTDFSSRAAKDIYGILGDEFHAMVPGSEEIDNRISSLIPVAKRAGATDLNANVLQRSIGRFARPTGALAGGVTGAYAGGKKYGTPGAIAGGIAGLVAPEIISSPQNLMTAARVADSPSAARLLAPAAASPLVVHRLLAPPEGDTIPALNGTGATSPTRLWNNQVQQP